MLFSPTALIFFFWLGLSHSLIIFAMLELDLFDLWISLQLNNSHFLSLCISFYFTFEYYYNAWIWDMDAKKHVFFDHLFVFALKGVSLHACKVMSVFFVYSMRVFNAHFVCTVCVCLCMCACVNVVAFLSMSFRFQFSGNVLQIVSF